MGGFLASLEKNKGGQHSHKKSTGRGESTGAPTLKNLGVTKDESSRYQRLALIPEECFDKIVKETNETRDRLTTERILKEAKDRGFLSRSKRMSETRAGSDGKVNVTFTLRLTEDEEEQFMAALLHLGERATKLIFEIVVQTAKRRTSNEPIPRAVFRPELSLDEAEKKFNHAYLSPSHYVLVSDDLWGVLPSGETKFLFSRNVLRQDGVQMVWERLRALPFKKGRRFRNFHLQGSKGGEILMGWIEDFQPRRSTDPPNKTDDASPC